jgi:hypothetical protein
MDNFHNNKIRTNIHFLNDKMLTKSKKTTIFKKWIFLNTTFFMLMAAHMLRVADWRNKVLTMVLLSNTTKKNMV